MKKGIIIISVILTLAAAASAAENSDSDKEKIKVTPLVQFDYLSLESQSIQSAGAGIVLNNEDVMFVGIYTRHSFEEQLLYDYPDVYHTIDTLLDGKNGRHQYIGIFKSESDRPVSGGLYTYQAAAVYGYEFFKGKSLSLVFGGGLALGDFGIERKNGDPWPVIPVPLMRITYSSDWIDTKFECITSPNISFTIGPESRIRFKGDFRMDQARDIRDLIFDLSIDYRFFNSDSESGDFAGISAGFKNDNYGAFYLGEEDGEESIEVHYYSLYGVLDISILKITGGYAFKGRDLYREEYKVDSGDGYFISVQGLYQF